MFALPQGAGHGRPKSSTVEMHGVEGGQVAVGGAYQLLLKNVSTNSSFLF